MKSLFAFAIYLVLTTNAFAQKNEGTIYYKETIKLEINFDDMPNLTPEMKAMFPQEQAMENVLYFNENASLYTGLSKAGENDVDYKSDDEDVQIKIQMDAPEHFYYQNLKNKEVVESRDLFGKKFLITSADKIKWKISSETKEILGHPCTKATAMAKDSMMLEAWFTTKIPASVGPDKFHNLPGAVLEASMDNGKRTIVATKIEATTDATKIVQPKKGKKVSQEEYRKIVEEKQKEMAAEYGGKGNVIIKTETIEN